MGEQIPKSENHRKVVALSVNVLLPVFRNRELLMKRQVWNVMLGAAMGEKPFVVGAHTFLKSVRTSNNCFSCCSFIPSNSMLTADFTCGLEYSYIFDNVPNVNAPTSTQRGTLWWLVL